jgi:hypothetical protein
MPTYVFGRTAMFSLQCRQADTGSYPRCQGQASSSSNRLLCAESLCCIGSPAHKPIILSDNYRPSLALRSFTKLPQPHSAVCPRERRCGSRKSKRKVAQVKCGCNPYRIRASASISQPFSYIISP